MYEPPFSFLKSKLKQSDVCMRGSIFLLDSIVHSGESFGVEDKADEVCDPESAAYILIIPSTRK